MRKGNRTTHGMSKTPIYNIWVGMKARCLNSNNPGHSKYGAKGVTVCNHWLEFEHFQQDMGTHEDGMTIDRIDPTGDYEPSNCRWATPFQQGSENRTDLRLVTIEGKTQNLSAWCRDVGVKEPMVRQRIFRGMGDIEALTLKAKEYKNPGISFKSDKGRKKRWVAHAKRSGVQHFVGYFSTERDATKARLEFIKTL